MKRRIPEKLRRIAAVREQQAQQDVNQKAREVEDSKDNLAAIEAQHSESEAQLVDSVEQLMAQRFSCSLWDAPCIAIVEPMLSNWCVTAKRSSKRVKRPINSVDLSTTTKTSFTSVSRTATSLRSAHESKKRSMTRRTLATLSQR